MTDSATDRPRCFVMMPFSAPDPYDANHCSDVYDFIFKPACEEAGFEAYRSDDDQGSNLIHIAMLREIIDAPMAICDLSFHNPNVLFELGLRQAFEKPVVLVQIEGTQRIFDISVTRTVDFRGRMNPRYIPNDVTKIAAAIRATVDTENRDASLISLLKFEAATSIESESDPSGIDWKMSVRVLEELSDMKAAISEFASGPSRWDGPRGPILGREPTPTTLKRRELLTTLREMREVLEERLSDLEELGPGGEGSDIADQIIVTHRKISKNDEEISELEHQLRRSGIAL